MISLLYRIYMQLVRGIYYYPLLTKVSPSKKLSLFPEKHDFLKNAICLSAICRTLGGGVWLRHPLSWKVTGSNPVGYQKIQPC